MPTAQNTFLTGTLTAAQTATLPASINVNLGFLPSKVRIFNQTQFGATGTGNENIQWLEWNLSNPVNTNGVFINAAGTALVPTQITVNGISQYDGTQSVKLGPSIAGTTITKANPAVATTAAHGLQTGDIVLMTNNVVMTQLGGTFFTVTVTGATTFTIPINTNTANFTQETGFVIRKLLVGPLYQPSRRTITAITAANPVVISTATNHGFTVGQVVRVRIPSTAFGMAQINKLQGVITAVTATTLTIGSIDSSAFSAFAYPATTSVPFTFPTVEPVGAGPTPTVVGSLTYYQDLLDDQTVNVQFQGFTIGTGILLTATAGVIGITASDVLSWEAWRADN